MIFTPFPSIGLFHNIVKAVGAYPHIATGAIAYKGKIKLHGTNAAVRINCNEIVAQSRTQIITKLNDNAGFAAWVENNRCYFETTPLAKNTINYTVFGEWCGKGIQKGTAISHISNKIFAIFAIMQIINDENDAVMIIEPSEIEKLLPDRPADIHILPWYGESFTVDLKNKNTLQTVVDKLNKVIEEVEPSDPWVKQVFGIDGTAEGIVYYPIPDPLHPLQMITRKTFSDLTFKAKGEKHKVVRTKSAVQIDPEVAGSIDEFVKMFATDARFEQGLAAIGGSSEMKNIPAFLKWVSLDINKESEDELAAAGLEWSDVQKSIQNVSRNWFILRNKMVTV